MLTIHKADQILECVKSIFFNQLNGKDINLMEIDNNDIKGFSFLSDGNGNNSIHFSSHINYNNQSRYIRTFIQNRLNNHMNKIMPDLLECFAFLHEIGHWFYWIAGVRDEKQYEEYFARDYEFHSTQAMAEYREIPSEAIADKFAMYFLNYYGKELWLILAPEVKNIETLYDYDYCVLNKTKKI